MTSRQNPSHSVIDRPNEFAIVSLSWRQAEEGVEACLDLVLERNGQTKHLRFFSPSSLQVFDGFPQHEGGLFIDDIRSKGWENIAVEVGNCEQNGGLHFYARTVEEIKQNK